MIRGMTLLAAVLALSACEGANEQAGEAQDRAAANAAGTVYESDGPGERAGRALDRAADAAKDATAAQADLLEKQARQVAVQADIQADRLEERAEQLRTEAEKRAELMKTEAEQLNP